MCYKIQKNIFWVHIRVLWSSFPLHWKPNILSVNYDSWWQHQMSVRELRHDGPSGWFSKSRGLSASVSFLPSPPPPRSFTCAIFRVGSITSRCSGKWARTHSKIGPADMAAISISMLATFFNVEPKSINRGENYYNSKHVEFLEYS